MTEVKMNKRRIKALAKRIEDLQHTNLFEGQLDHSDKCFNMTRYAWGCGAPSCLAGWAFYWYGDKKKVRRTFWSDEGSSCIFEEAKDVLGLTNNEAVALFEPDIDYDYEAITPKDASKALLSLLNAENMSEFGIEELSRIVWNDFIKKYEGKNDG